MYNTYYSLVIIEWLQNIACKIGNEIRIAKNLQVLHISIIGNPEFIGHKIEIPVVISDDTNTFI